MANFALWSDIAAERFDLAGCFLVELLILTSSTRKSDPDPDRIIGSRDIAFSVFLEYLRNGRTGDIKLFFKRWANMSSIQRLSNRRDRLNRSDVRIIYIRPVCFRSKCISSLIFDFFSTALRLFVGLGSVSRNCIHFFNKTSESGEKFFFLKFSYGLFFSYISVTASARDDIVTLKYAWYFPLSKAVFIVWIRRPSPEKSFFL